MRDAAAARREKTTCQGYQSLWEEKAPLISFAHLVWGKGGRFI